jgi:thiamine-phosphate pyrophosphorylase
VDDKSVRLSSGLYALIDDSLVQAAGLEKAARAAAEGGASVLQLRLKHTSDRDALALIRAVAAAVRPRGTQVIVNDRVDLALLGDADGVHLGKEDLPVAQARALLGPDKLIGATVRTVADIEAAKREGADHVGLGPIFATRTKALTDAPIGVERFAALVKESPLPVVGISGVALSNIASVARAGARAAAVASDLLGAPDVSARAASLAAAFRVGCER